MDAVCCSSFFYHHTVFVVFGPRFSQAIGIETNLWGLACPFHCGSPSITALILAFLSGFLWGWSLDWIGPCHPSDFFVSAFTPISGALSPQGFQGQSPSLSRTQAYL